MKTHRQLDHNSHKRDKYKQQRIAEIRKHAEEKRDIAYVKRHGRPVEKDYITQTDYISKYFEMNW